MISDLITQAEDACDVLYMLWQYKSVLNHPEKEVREKGEACMREAFRRARPLHDKLYKTLQQEESYYEKGGPRPALAHQQIWNLRGDIPFHRAIYFARLVEEAHGIFNFPAPRPAVKPRPYRYPFELMDYHAKRRAERDAARKAEAESHLLSSPFPPESTE